MRLLAAALGTLLLAPGAGAMTIRVTEADLGAQGAATTIYLSGEIRPGDADRVADRLASLALGPDAVAHVVLDSPGGSLVDGLGIGRAIAALPARVTTDVGAGATRAADCASACVFAFMGGHYRSLRSGSRLGVHQFYPTEDNRLTGAEGIAVGQVLSAEIVAFLAEMRVDPRFYTLVTQPLPEDILWVSAEDLESYGVTTGSVRDQRVEYRNAEGFFYLTLWQEGFYGENKMLLSCNDRGGVAFIAYLQPPDLEAVRTGEHAFEVTLDGAVEPPAQWDLIGTDETWAIALFTLTDDQAARLGRAESFGARLVPAATPELFFGFDYRFGEDGALVRDMIEGCRLQQEMGFAGPADPAAPADPALAPALTPAPPPEPAPDPDPDPRLARFGRRH